MTAAHPNSKTGSAAKLAAFVCFAVAVALMIASLVSAPARAGSKNGVAVDTALRVR